MEITYHSLVSEIMRKVKIPKYDEVGKINVIFDYTVTQANTDKTIGTAKLDLLNDGFYEILIVGSATVTSDVLVRLNNYTGSNYYQSGYNFLGALESSGSLTEHNKVYRPANTAFYYSHNLSTVRTIIKAMLFISHEQNGDIFPMYEWTCDQTVGARQLHAHCSGVCFINMNAGTNITNITFYCENGYFGVGTRIIIRKLL